MTVRNYRDLRSLAWRTIPNEFLICFPNPHFNVLLKLLSICARWFYTSRPFLPSTGQVSFNLSMIMTIRTWAFVYLFHISSLCKTRLTSSNFNSPHFFEWHIWAVLTFSTGTASMHRWSRSKVIKNTNITLLTFSTISIYVLIFPTINLDSPHFFNHQFRRPYLL